MTYGVHGWLGLPSSWEYPVLTGAYVMAMYLLNPYLDPLGLGAKGPARARFLERNKVHLVGVSLACLVGAMFLSAALGPGTFLMVIVASILGLTYKRGLRFGSRRLRLQAIPASKDLLVAFALATIAVVIPLWHNDSTWDRRAWAGILLGVRAGLRPLHDPQHPGHAGRPGPRHGDPAHRPGARCRQDRCS